MSVFPKNTWRHNEILGIIAEIAKICFETANKISCIKTSIQFVKVGNVSKTPHRSRHKPTLLDVWTDWRVIADVDRQLAFPTEITSTRQRPDLIIWSVNSENCWINDPFRDQHRLGASAENEKVRRPTWTGYQEWLVNRHISPWDWILYRTWDRFYIELNHYIFNQTQTFISKEEGIYKKDQNEDCNCIWTDMAFVQSKHHSIKSGSIVRYCWGALC